MLPECRSNVPGLGGGGVSLLFIIYRSDSTSCLGSAARLLSGGGAGFFGALVTGGLSSFPDFFVVCCFKTVRKRHNLTGLFVSHLEGAN